jgi:hypothetical protein
MLRVIQHGDGPEQAEVYPATWTSNECEVGISFAHKEFGSVGCWGWCCGCWCGHASLLRFGI